MTPNSPDFLRDRSCVPPLARNLLGILTTGGPDATGADAVFIVSFRSFAPAAGRVEARSGWRSQRSRLNTEAVTGQASEPRFRLGRQRCGLILTRRERTAPPHDCCGTGAR